MRRRLRSGMARRIGEDRRIRLTPRALRIGGWIVAALLIVGVAVVVGVLGGEADGVGAGSPTPGSTGSAAGTTPIVFGAGLDESTGGVADDARTSRFTSGEVFAYSVQPGATVPTQVYVAVRRSSGGQMVQAPVRAQLLPNPDIIAFSVPADALLADFGPGRFRMLIYQDPDQAPIAEGEFELVAGAVSPSVSSSAPPQ